MKFEQSKLARQPYYRNFPFAESKATEGVRLSNLEINLEVIGIEETNKVLRKLRDAITIYSARALAIIAVDLLAKAQPRVPYDIGFLRDSGIATLKMGRSTEIVGIGKTDGTVESRIGNVNKAKLRGVRTIRADVSYSRTGDKGEDVALWTHEDLLPYEARPRKPAATKPGTGPKYLEIPWLENVGTYIDFIESDLSGEGFEKNISTISRIRQKRLGKYKLDYVDIIVEQIAMGGYYPPQLKRYW